MSKRICIIGGTGFVGREIADQAIDAGYKVVVTSRCPSRARDLLVKGITVVKADVSTGKGLSEAVSGCDTVINLVGLLYSRGRNTFDAAHVGGAKHVVDACKDANVSQLLHMSALLSDDAAKNSAYGKTKTTAESLVKKSGLNWTIFKPSIIFGSRDSFLMKFKALSSFGPVLPVIAGNTKFQPIWVKDVARAFVSSIGNKAVSQKSYELAGDEVYSFNEILSMWMGALSRNRILLPVPGFAASIMATVSSFLPVPLITSDQLKLLKSDNVTDEKFPEIFGSPSSFKFLLHKIATGGQATILQKNLDHSRTIHRKS